MARNEVVYVVKPDQSERVVVGAAMGWRGQCAKLVRFGRHVTTFIITPAQLRRVRAGKKIHITSKAITAADRCNRR